MASISNRSVILRELQLFRTTPTPTPTPTSTSTPTRTSAAAVTLQTTRIRKKRALKERRREESMWMVSSKYSLFAALRFYLILVLLLISTVLVAGVSRGYHADNFVNWDHAVELNEDFRLLWTIIDQDIILEVQAHALGYIGFGFSKNGKINGSDLAFGWVDRGQTYFQDRYVDGNGDTEPLVDPSQDYILIMGYENATHTVLRFRRKLDTCDPQHDIPITNDTMRLIYIYSDKDPPHGDTRLDRIFTDPSNARRNYRSLILTQRPKINMDTSLPVRVLELRNEDVELPMDDNALHWCKMFKLDDIKRKHHIIRYEPIFDSSISVRYLQHLTLYECQGTSFYLEELSRQQGYQCMGAQEMPLDCNEIVAAWSRGSQEFVFPKDAGYPIETRQAKYYLLETLYNNLQLDLASLHRRQMADNSGLKIYFTRDLRANDAGVLSIGVDPDWRHIIPPGQSKVVSEGHCIENCTSYAFPAQGINIFAVMMRTHLIGKQVKFHQIRASEELVPIAQDTNIDSYYQSFRVLASPIRSMPGERLIVQCIYDSSTRKAITLGGLSMKEESCIVLTLYYPRQRKLTKCHSLPSLSTVLHSLGIEQLATNSNQVTISAPKALAGMTLEERLISYDWENQFDQFQAVTRKGSFKALCWGAKNTLISGLQNLEGHAINITKIYETPKACTPRPPFIVYTTTTTTPARITTEDDRGNDLEQLIIEGAARSSRSSSASNQRTPSSINWTYLTFDGNFGGTLLTTSNICTNILMHAYFYNIFLLYLYF